MAGAYGSVRVYLDHDSQSWFMTLLTADGPGAPVQLTAADLTTAKAAAVTALQAQGSNVISAWKDGDPEAGSVAVFSEAGAADRTKGTLLSLWSAHKALLLKLGIDVTTLAAGQRALLFSQDVMLAGLTKTLIDKGLVTSADIDAACSAVGAADFSWLTGL